MSIFRCLQVEYEVRSSITLFPVGQPLSGAPPCAFDDTDGCGGPRGSPPSGLRRCPSRRPTRTRDTGPWWWASAGFASSPQEATLTEGDYLLFNWQGPDTNHSATADAGQPVAFDSD